MKGPLESLKVSAAQALVRFLKLGGMVVSSIGERQGIEPHEQTVAFQDAYRSNVWVYAGIYAIASAGASVPFKVMRRVKRKGKLELEEVPGHPFAKLLDRPNEHMTGYDLVELLFIHLESTGNSFWLLDNGAAEPLPKGAKLSLKQVKELWPIPPQYMKPLPDKTAFIGGYRMDACDMGKAKTFAAAEIAHVKYANPLSMHVGQGSLEPAKGGIISDTYAEQYDSAFWKNGAIPPAFLKTEKSLTPEQRAELKETWAKAYSGAANAHKVALLEAGLDFSMPTQTRKDMEFVEGRKSYMTRILAALGVPPIMLGLLDEATYNNAKEQKRVFWENTMRPKLAKVAATLTRVLQSLGEPEDLVVVPDLSNVEALQEDHKAKADTAQVWVNAGLPLNEAIRLFGPKGMEPVEGGDVGLVNAGLVTLEDVALGMADDQVEPEGTPEDAPAPGKPKPVDEDDEADDVDAGDKAMSADARKAAENKKLDDAYWRAFVANMAPDARRLRAILRRHFKAQRAKVLRLVSDHYAKHGHLPDAKERLPSIEVLLLSWTAEAADLAAKAKPQLKSTYLRFGAGVVADAGVGVDFNLESQAAIKFLDRRAFQFADLVTNTTKERLRGLLQDQLQQGVSQADLVDAIKAEFRFAERYRATRIARTETQMAANAGIQDGLEQAGFQGKKWLSSRDEEVRESHKQADGDVVAVDDPFDLDGVMLDFPGDPKGPAGEIINCRCTMRGIFRRTE